MLWNANINENVLIILDRMPSKEEAVKYVKEQHSYYSPRHWQDMIEINNISFIEDIPKEWRGNEICFGDNYAEYSATQYLKLNNEIYNEEKEEFLEARETYLRLKGKFEP